MFLLPGGGVEQPLMQGDKPKSSLWFSLHILIAKKNPFLLSKRSVPTKKLNDGKKSLLVPYIQLNRADAAAGKGTSTAGLLAAFNSQCKGHSSTTHENTSTEQERS